MLLTATATAEAREELVRRFCSPALGVQSFIGSIDRPSVALCIRRMPSSFNNSAKTPSPAVWNADLVEEIVAEIGADKAIVYIDSKAAVANIATAFRGHNVAVGEVVGSDGHQTPVERDETILNWLRGDIQVGLFSECSVCQNRIDCFNGLFGSQLQWRRVKAIFCHDKR